MLQIILPVPFVPCPVHMDVNTIAVGFIIVPLTLEHIAVNMPELALAASFIESPVPLVPSSIRPDLDAIAMLHISKPLALVHSPVLKDYFTLIF